MRILLVDQFGEIGGAQRCLLDLVPALAERGWTTDAAVPAGPFADALRAAGTRVVEIPCGPFRAGRKSPVDHLRFAAQISNQIAAISALQSEIVYVNGPRLLLAAALALRNRPLVFHAHSIVPQRSAASLARWSLRHSHAYLIASSKFVEAPLASSIPNERRCVIYNGCSKYGECPKPTRDREGAVPRQPAIAVIGRIAPEKGQLDFVRAAKILHSEIPQCRFVLCGAPLFAGDDYAHRIRDEAQGLPLEFTGWQANTSALLSEIDLLVVPSSTIDATPRVVIEAFAAGVPVVAYESGGMEEMIEDDVNGIVVRRRNPRNLADAIATLLRDPSRRQRMSQAAEQSWRQRFRIERYRSEICDFLGALFERTYHRRSLQRAGAIARA